MVAHPETNELSNPALFKSRNRTVAKSFYRQLRSEGFSHEQIIELSTTLLDLVTDDMRPESDDEA